MSKTERMWLYLVQPLQNIQGVEGSTPRTSIKCEKQREEKERKDLYLRIRETFSLTICIDKSGFSMTFGVCKIKG